MTKERNKRNTSVECINKLFLDGLFLRKVFQMLLRPVDASGDILPVLSSSDLESDPESVALLVRDRLNLLSGEWWENPA